MNEIRVADFETAAILRLNGVSFLGADVLGERVILRFADQDGEATALVNQHNSEGVNVNSQDYSDAVRWARDKVFATRRLSGLR